MTGFQYTSLTPQEIFNKITYISQELFPGIIYLISIIIIVTITINYIFPIILFSVEHIKKELAKKKRKELIRKIVLQKEVEDEIEKSFITKK